MQKEIQDLNNWFSKHTFQYEIPHCLSAEYIDNIIFLNILSNGVGLISSRPIYKLYKDIDLYYMDEQEVKKKTIKLTTELNRKIDLERMKFELIYKFNQIFQGQWYMLASKHIAKYQVDIQQFRQGGQRNYLFVPIQENQIDFQGIQDFLNKKKRQNSKCEIYQHTKTQNLYCVYKILEDIGNNSVSSYLSLMMEYANFNMDQIKQFYEIDETIFDKSIQYFLFEHPFQTKKNNIESIIGLRSLSHQKPEIKNQPIALLKQTTNILSIHYFTDDQMKSLLPKDSVSTIKPKLKLTKPIMAMFPISNLEKYYFTVQEYDNYMALPFIMLDMEQQQVIAQFATSINLEISPTVSKSLTRPSFHSDHNYELLETLGDSILKYFATMKVSLENQNTNENELSELRTRIVNNNFIAVNFFKNNHLALNFFIRSLNHQTKWYSPCLQNIFLNQIQPELVRKCEAKLIVSFLADIFEALIAASFQQNYSIKDAYTFLQLAGHPTAQAPIDSKYFPSYPLYLQWPSFEMNNSLTFKELVNTNYVLHSKDIQAFQDNILFYQFKNIQILQEAFNAFTSTPLKIDIPLELYYQYLQSVNQPSARGHQVLELIGDAVLECFIMCNCYNYFTTKFTPTHLYKIKMILLSNSFLAKISVAYGLHSFFDDESVFNFSKEVNLNEKFTQYNGNFVRVPKVLSDFFEAICGAVLLDGGWDAIVRFLGQIYAKFVPFVCTYINEIDDHVIDRIHQYSSLQQGHMDMQIIHEVGNLVTCQIMINNQIVGRATHEFERVAKEKAAEAACRRLRI